MSDKELTKCSLVCRFWNDVVSKIQEQKIKKKMGILMLEEDHESPKTLILDMNSSSSSRLTSKIKEETQGEAPTPPPTPTPISPKTLVIVDTSSPSSLPIPQSIDRVGPPNLRLRFLPSPSSFAVVSSPPGRLSSPSVPVITSSYSLTAISGSGSIAVSTGKSQSVPKAAPSRVTSTRPILPAVSDLDVLADIAVKQRGSKEPPKTPNEVGLLVLALYLTDASIYRFLY